MKEIKVPFDRKTWDRFVRMVKGIRNDPEIGKRAQIFFFGLILFFLVINGLNVVNSYVGRDFMTAIEQRNRSQFLLQALLYIGVFAASTVVSVMARYIEESLGLLSRQWLSWRILRRYVGNRVYFRLAEAEEAANPDQRIAEDVRSLTATTLSFFLMLLNGFLTILAFSGVLWSISPQLFLIAIAYASAGTYLSYRIGRPLVQLDYQQSDKEARFRAALLQLGENADMVALSRREAELSLIVKGRLDDLAENFMRIIRTNRNLGFCTTGYNWLIQIIPALVVAPLFIDGRAEFGVITQSAIAFTHLLGAFSLIVTQFQSISSFAAVITRIGVLAEASMREKDQEIAASEVATDHWRIDSLVAYRSLTLRSPRSDRILVENLNAEIPAGKRVLVFGPDETARDALFRASAGLWPPSSGQIVRPPLEQILFVSERPYLYPGTLREIFLRPWPDRKPESPVAVPEFEREALESSETDIRGALAAVGLENLANRFGGLDRERDWDSLIPLSEQQLLVIARVLVSAPRFVFLDRPDTALSDEQVEKILSLFRQHRVATVVLQDKAEHLGRYDATLEIESGGQWRWRDLSAVTG